VIIVVCEDCGEWPAMWPASHKCAACDEATAADEIQANANREAAAAIRDDLAHYPPSDLREMIAQKILGEILPSPVRPFSWAMEMPAMSRPEPPDPAVFHRRVKIVVIPARDVLDWFLFALTGWPRCVSLPKLDGLPAGVKVLSVRENWAARTFEFLVAHHTFEVVPDGMMPPEFPEPLKRESVTVELRHDPLTGPLAELWGLLTPDCGPGDVDGIARAALEEIRRIREGGAT
jgi:hypothetical protein